MFLLLLCGYSSNIHISPSTTFSETFEIPPPSHSPRAHKISFPKFFPAGIPVQKNFLQNCASIYNPYHNPGPSSVLSEHSAHEEVPGDHRAHSLHSLRHQ